MVWISALILVLLMGTDRLWARVRFTASVRVRFRLTVLIMMREKFRIMYLVMVTVGEMT
jgi:hypothetical protein